MSTKTLNKSKENKKIIDSAIAKVAGAVMVASVAVEKAMAIKDEAINEIESIKSQVNSKAKRNAVKKIKNDTKIN